MLIRNIWQRISDEELKSTIVEVMGRRTWKQNWKQTLDCKLVYVLGKTVEDMVLDIYLRQIASSHVKSVWCFECYFWNQQASFPSVSVANFEHWFFG